MCEKSDKDYFAADGKLLLAKNMPITPEIAGRLKQLKAVRYIKKKSEVMEEQLKDTKSKMKAEHYHLFTNVVTLLTDMIFSPENAEFKYHINVLSNYISWIYTHSLDVATISGMMAMTLSYDKAKFQNLTMGAFLHDVGKILIPKRIWNKNGPLTPMEWEIVRQHPTLGYDSVSGYIFPDEIKNIIVQHHERLDGSGYPYQLRGNEISDGAQIVMIADSFDAMTMNRLYRKGITPSEAIQRLMDDGEKYNQDLVRVLASIIVQ